nr:hypothetical protein [Tanacetum cinerariifolium]
QCTCKSCRKGAHYGYNCPSKVPIISNSESCHDQNVEEFPQTLPSSHPTCYFGDENSFAYDLTPNLVKDSPNVFNLPSQPPMHSYEFYRDDAHYSCDYPPQVPFIYDPEPCYSQDFNFIQNFQSFQQQYRCCENYGGPHETFQCQQVIFYDPCYENCGGPHESKITLCYDDDDEESSIPLRDIIISELPSFIAITPVVSTKDSLITGDEHLDTIREKESDEFTKSSVKNLVLNPSESEDEQSLLNQDSSIISSSKIDSLLDEFVGELNLLKSIPPGIDEADCDPKEEIRLIKKLLYDNSSPRPLKEFIYENSDAAIESFSPSPILVEDSDSLMEEIDLSLTPDDSMPPSIEDDDYDSKGDILHFLKMSHFILIFHHPLALLRNHRMMMKLSPIQEF